MGIGTKDVMLAIS